MKKFRLKRIANIISNTRLYLKYRIFLGHKIDSSEFNNRIILISHDSGDSGAVILLLEMIKEFHKKKYEIMVLTRNYGPLLRKASEYSSVYVFSNEKKFNKIIKKAYKDNFRNVICNTVVTGDLVPILKNNSFNVITLVHELPKVIQELNVNNRALLLALNSDIVIFPSEYVRDRFPHLDKIKGKLLIKPQGVNFIMEESIDCEDAKKTLFDMYSIPTGNKLVLGVGAGYLRKGYDIFLDLAYKSQRKGTSFVWVGLYSKEIYNKKMKTYGVEELDNLYQVGFIDDKHILSSFYAATDVFTLTSREDPFPSVVLQAFNAKVPVIAFRDAGGFGDIVVNEETGYLVEYENVYEMLTKIDYLLTNSTIRTNMGNNAKAKLKDYHFEDYIDYLINLQMQFSEISR